MPAYAVIHVTKLSGNSGGIGAHIDRKHTPKNANPDAAHLNKELVKSATGSLSKDIEQRIKEGYTSDRKIRTDAVKGVGVILSGTHEQMKKIEKDGNLDAWTKANLKFVQDRFGEKNIIRATMHMDERTPHMHVVFTPITNDGRLHFKTFLDGKEGLTKLQDDYSKEMAKFGLNRGLEQSRATHTTTREYYAKLEAVSPVTIKTNLLGQPKEGEEERLTEEFKKIQASAIEKKNESSRLYGAFVNETKKTKELTEQLQKSKEGGQKMSEIIKRLVVNKDLPLLKQLEEKFKTEQKPVQNQNPNRGHKI